MSGKMQLQRLKKMYDAAHEGARVQKELLERREELEEQPERREELRRLDREIDLHGEEPEIEAEELKRELIAAICAEYPDAAERYEALSARLERAERNIEQLEREVAALTPFEEALHEGAAADSGSRLKGLFFGRNAKVLLARAIQRALAESEGLSLHHEEMAAFIKRFRAEAGQPWHGALYKGRFRELYEEFVALRAEIEGEEEQSRQEARTVECEIAAWIERYVRG